MDWVSQGVEQLEGSPAIGALAYFTKSHPQRHGTG
jgi:hypothetical protein